MHRPLPEPSPSPPHSHARAPTLRRWLGGLAATASLALCAGLALWVFGPKGLQVDQVAKTWQLEIEVERRTLETGSGWCDELPETAQVLSRRWLDSDPSGQRSGAVEHCHYRSPQWRTSYVAQSQGQAPAAAVWPQPVLRPGDPERQGLGEERLGKRQSFYELQLQASDGRAWSCRQSLADWQGRPAQARYRVQVDRYGVADCASLPPAAPPARGPGAER
ncbi:hypothetical protein [Paucibacter sp. DJ2R-2]|uniref:hypothetical protein n=1 Tax=Paucibacter sp. DJ2R-2 TaxID=2893558 RepID=UPI0021E3C8BB|nr:hypothetical protein [Paucibacter sp. DJ2R-2]MCV2421583.1 hypothetical protein [Paucibacter sp. DJ4R-1]MCV2438288.1 hypothetical protein [Paucibacter sp. DJ2R-2]